MPIFEYVCGKCGEKFERIVFASSPSPVCTSCGGSDVEKVPSVFGFSSGGKTVTSAGRSGCENCTASSCADCE